MRTTHVAYSKLVAAVCSLLVTIVSAAPLAQGEVQVHRTSAPVSLAADANTTLSVTWDAAFPDANYTPVCSLTATDNGNSGFAIVASKTAAGMNVSVRNGSASNAHTYQLNCIAVQNGASPAGIAYATTTQSLAADSSMDLVLNWSQAVPNGTAVCTLGSSTATSGYALILLDGLTTISVRLRNTSAQSADTYDINCIDVPITTSLVVGMTQGELEPIDFAADTTQSVQVDWGATLPNTSYTAVCSPETLSNAVSSQALITSLSTTAVTLNLRNTSATSAETIGVTCLAATSTDTTPPTVSITAPAGGATVTGTTNVTANATDDIGVVGVQFKLDGNNLGSEDTASPYSVSWDTTQTPTGSHNLTAVARDAAGNKATSTVVTVTVARTDTTPPTVSITAPANGATVSGTNVIVTGTASDDVGVVGVQFKIDGANLGTESMTAPYSAPWNTTVVSNGTHTLGAVARDAAGNLGTATAISVTVNNAAPDFQMTFEPGSPTSATVKAGDGTGFGVRFAPSSTVTSVSLSCTSVPAGPTCQFGPSTTATINLSTTASTDVLVNIATTIGPPPPHNGTGPVGTAVPFLAGVVLFGTLLGTRPRKKHMMTMLLSILLIGVITTMGCSNNSNADVQQQTVVPGSYTITLSATGGTVTRTMQFPLTVTR